MIEVENLVKKYGNKTAIENVSFKVEKGEVVGFLGPNGAGKSTTMNIITGFLSSSSGTAKVAGLDVLEYPFEAKKLIGYLPEQPPLYMDMKVNEYLDFVYELKDCKLNREEHLNEICTVTKIADVRNRLIGNLSKGYRQRLGIAQALIGNPPVIILDEPTVGLDPKQVIEIRSLIRLLGKDHTVILSTHILSEVQSICSRVIVINDGRIIADEAIDHLVKVVDESRKIVAKISGPQKDIIQKIKGINGVINVDLIGERESDGSSYKIESSNGIDIRKPLFFAMAENGWPILGLEIVGESLEDVFVKITDADEKKKNLKIRGNRSYRGEEK